MADPIVPNSASFLITDVGLAAASVAKPDGPYIEIVEFRIGDGYGYTPSASDVGLNGNTVYTGIPTSYQFVAPDTLDILCELPPEAGYFEFGEVGLYLPGGVLFAKAVFQKPQQKFPKMTSATVNTYSLHCLLKLKQALALINVTVQQNPAVLNVYCWSDVRPVSKMVNPYIPELLVHELDSAGSSTLLQQSAGDLWTVGTTHYPYINSQPDQRSFPVVAASTTWIEVSAALMHPRDLSVAGRQILVRTADGYFRSVQSVTVNGSNYRLNLNCTNDGTYNNFPLPSVPSGHINIFQNDIAPGHVFYSQIIDPPSIPLATLGNPGLAYGRYGTYMPGPGVIETYGMLQNPSLGVNQIVGAGEDLNKTSWTSGLYTIDPGGHGFPANMPVSASGHLWVHSEFALAVQQGINSNNITQIFYPAGNGGGDNRGRGGYPPYWREWNALSDQNNGQGGWTDWFALNVIGKQGGGTGSVVSAMSPNSNVEIDKIVTLTIPSAGNWTIMGWAHGMVSVYHGAVLYIDAAAVDSTGAYGDTEGIGFNTLWGTVSQGYSAGQQVQVRMHTNSTTDNYGDFRVMALALKL
ncbi:tail collar protein [Burkholderia phage BcepSaruman]|uniref:Tail collar protein n=1 Tax=Burkholderia phage BcepSaruman TaxID=2530032 RepID=A0A4D5ZEH9_9CAUD|nr:tail collar protein [Burkholderia phage BcepSaruman]QBX06677.1 tail collar protein [Burkholderia phage BcepSaruman]